MNRNPLVTRVTVIGTVFGGLLFFAVGAAVPAQEPSLEDLFPGLRQRAVVLNIVARVIEQDQQESWNVSDSRVTIPGRPVGMKLVGANIVVMIQFTPYIWQNGSNVLIVQGQIWLDIPNEGLQYQTTLKTIPLEFGEEIYFFPLGQGNSLDKTHIEIQVALNPYPLPSEEDASNSPARNEALP